MKKTLIIVLSVFIFLIGMLVALPFIFHDKVAEVIKDQLEKNLDTRILFNTDKVGLSLLSSFPNMIVSLEDFGLVGIGEFKGDTLFYADEIDLNVNIKSVISGETIVVNSVALTKPIVNIIATKEGTFNYDISKKESIENNETEVQFTINIKDWNIKKGYLTYEDRSLPFSLSLKDFDNSGKGDFTQDIFDLQSMLEIQSVTAAFGGIPYLSDKHAIVDLNMEMNLPEQKYTFKENTISISKLDIGVNGFIQTIGEDILTDVTFDGKKMSVQSIMSLIPGVYEASLSNITANGTASLSGYVKGLVTEDSLPDIYAAVGIRNGNIAHSKYPIPLESINMSAVLSYPKSGPRDAEFNMSKFNMILGGEKFESVLRFKNFEDYKWDFMLNGKVDLDQLIHVIPIKATTLTGVAEAHIKSMGRLSDLKKERYDMIPSSGNISITNLSYSSDEFKEGLSISEASASIDTRRLTVQRLNGTIGKSDFQTEGTFENYIGYLLDENEILRGKARLNASLIDLNEWMTEAENSNSKDTTSLDPIIIPENLDLTFNSLIKRVNYDNLKLDNLNGNLIVKNGMLTIERSNFSMLEGDFDISGNYKTKKGQNSVYDFAVGIKELSIPAAFQSFETVQKLVPIAKSLTGDFSTDFKISGALDNNMNPIYEQTSGKGPLEIARAAMSKNNLINTLETFTSLKKTYGNQITLRDIAMFAEIKNGRIHFDPFDLSIGGKEFTINGSNGLAGDMDYSLKTIVPKGETSTAVTSLLSSASGIDKLANAEILLGIKLTGTIDDPKFSIASTELVDANGKSVTAKKVIKSTIKDKKEEVRDEAKQEIEERKEEVKDRADQEAEKAKKAADKKLEEAKKKAADKLKGIFGN